MQAYMARGWGRVAWGICEYLYVLGQGRRDVFRERTFGKAETKARFKKLCLGLVCRTVIVA